MCVFAYTHTHVNVWRQRPALSVLNPSLPCYLRQGLSLSLELTSLRNVFVSIENLKSSLYVFMANTRPTESSPRPKPVVLTVMLELGLGEMSFPEVGWDSKS